MPPTPPDDPPPDEHEPPDDHSGPGPEGNPYVDEVSATARTAESSGRLFDEAYRPGESGEHAGLVAGAPSDPVLVAGVGYPLLGDLSVGTVIAYRVAALELPGVAVADCSNTPVAAYQTITEGEHDTLVVVGPEKRGGDLNDGSPSENPGAVHEYDGDAFEAPEGRIVDLVGESAMGSNTVENVLIVTRALSDLPEHTFVITVEPGYDSWGMTVDEFTDPVADVLDDVFDRVVAYATATRDD